MYMSVVYVQRTLHCSSQKKTLETVHIYTKGNHISIFQFIESFQQITLQFTACFGVLFLKVWDKQTTMYRYKSVD